ncbi:MAG: GntR family transcriptional regulator [Acidobacteriaceae bacterium]|nr:GntR family transcriptional regulator [Acidobacteriaceae bacterium]
MTKYGQIAHDLREAIMSGDYPAGSTLPAIPELMTRYDVARDTVRDAIGLLTNEGLVIPKRGIGTVVREIDPVDLHYSASAPARTWQEQTSGAGQDVVVQADWESADRDVAERLSISAGDRVVHRVRHFTKGHGVAQITEQWIPEHIATAISGDLTSAEDRPDKERNLFQLMADAGHAPAETTENIGTRMPDPGERETMEVPPGVPVLVTRRTTVDAQNQPLETTTAIGAGDRMSASFTVALEY